VLSAIGTGLAVLLAWWGVQVLRGSMPDGIPRVAAIAVDLRVLAAAALVSLVTGVLFGIVPSLQASKPDLTHALKEGSRGSAGRVGQRLRAALVVVEVALAVVLLVGAALFIGSFVTLMRIDPGIDPHNVLTVSIAPRRQPGAPPPDHSAAFVQIVERIRQAPGVEYAAAISGGMPLGGAMSSTSMTVPGRKVDDPTGISVRRVTPDYHRALRIPLKRGRLFTEADRTGSAEVVILSELAAKVYFPGEDPIGRTVNSQGGDRTVVGVVGDVHQTSLETPPITEFYVPIAQRPVPFAELVIRTSVNPYQVLPAVKAAVLGVLPDVPLRNVRTLEEVLAGRVAQRRLNMLLLGLFGALGLVISAVGIYGVMSYVVAQRTREIGVRMALGATRATVVLMVLRSASVMVGIGLVVGGVAAWQLSATARSFLFRLETTDPRAFGVAIAALVVAALAASLVPARRAATVDPMIALRSE
jgi:predicted permease